MSDDMDRRTHVADLALAGGADEYQAMFVAYLTTHRLLVEVLEQVGGEVTLPPGFQERLTDESLTALTSPTEDGGTMVTVIQTPPEYRSSGPGPGVACGSFWRRHRDEDHVGVRYRVERVDTFGYAEMTPMSGGLALQVKTSTLLDGADGWRRAEG